MEIEDLGFNDQLEEFLIVNKHRYSQFGRVVEEHKERYIVQTAEDEYEAQITGSMRFTAKSREDFPAVGDWVVLITFKPDIAIIYKIFPRSSILKRQAVGQSGEVQVIATNVDFALLVQAVDRDFSINRLERYLTICNSSQIKPVIILTKIDLSREQQVSEILSMIKSRIKNVPVIALSNESQEGYEQLKMMLEKGKTYCMLGSSGVGKSTLLNNLCGRNVMQTEPISQHTNKGRHITSYRELIVLENGAILVDNPGMREVGIADSTSGLEITFNQIIELSQMCKFKDCTHTSEIGCSVLEAVEKGTLDRASYENYLKMEKEKVHFASTAMEKRKKVREFGKIMKNYKKSLINNK